jgi:hypothetical protein
MRTLFRRAAGFLGALLLLPIPAYAALDFGAWTSSVNNNAFTPWTTTGSSPAGGAVSTLIFQPSSDSTAATVTFTMQSTVSNTNKATADIIHAIFLTSNLIQLNSGTLAVSITVTDQSNETYLYGKSTTGPAVSYGPPTTTPLTVQPITGDYWTHQFGGAQTDRTLKVTFGFTNATWTSLGGMSVSFYGTNAAN